MISFPVPERLDVEHYGLFPGLNEEANGLHVEFKPGLTRG